ncbi:uncharacterized protein SPPG_01814 [Spizellomyces punctatus DAOM BR117]|uniref:RING-type domain-containing protein n=1 Tax=Spizellomyces punctatus (strain DAOM BR117) TaxID=645134 RepID=A0A0L0HMS6_SPIPD|nr:uncharacterized protein SPPG_01814 [Spizellomyces punctatus DAOM BR117]KND02731.1 hypothetical protein SPPG_01814 [Spizellomyces punctatus DAOM BR117]|eukprot:XP_016610770.1 hypothetical protein SPPG_01814 [Spizellomyces punctatus DAOM BR117]
MKFAKQYTEAYRDLPPSWPAFQYKALKKNIRRIVQELEEKGIVVHDAPRSSGMRHCTIDYFLEGNLEPFIVVNLQDEMQPVKVPETDLPPCQYNKVDPFPLLQVKDEDEGLAIEVGPGAPCGSGSLRIKITSRSMKNLNEFFQTSGGESPVEDSPVEDRKAVPAPSEPIPVPFAPSVARRGSISRNDSSPPTPTLDIPSARQRLTVNTDMFTSLEETMLSPGTPPDESGSVKLFLKTDHQFFHELATAVNSIAQFEDSLKTTFQSNLDTLSDYLSTAASPYNKDMYAWRKVLAAYLESEIWLINGIKDRPVMSSREQLAAFERTARGSLQMTLKSSSSTAALNVFLRMNREMLAMKQFDEINHTAVRKILKKHDKRTRLTASTGFARFLEEQSFFVDNIARAIVFTIQERLVTVIPQPEDYSCPICQDVYWKPIRLVCGHVFCVRCLVKAQVRNVKNCPVCRHVDAVEKATAEQLDVARMNMIKLYFPKEVKRKAIDSGRERAAEDLQTMFGEIVPPPNDSQSSCLIL